MVRISAGDVGREKALDVLVGAIAGDCSDAGAIHLRNRFSKAVGHYAIGCAEIIIIIKRKKKKKRSARVHIDGNGYALFLAETYRTWCNP